MSDTPDHTAHLKPVMVAAGTATKTRHRIADLIWAYMCVGGGAPIEADDVRRRLSSFLEQRGKISVYRSLSAAWNRMRDAEWCDWAPSDNGSRVVMMELRPGYDYKAYLDAWLEKAPHRAEPQPQRENSNDTITTPVPLHTITLPTLPKTVDDVPHLREITDGLIRLYEVDQVKYRNWAVSMKEQLKRIK